MPGFATVLLVATLLANRAAAQSTPDRQLCVNDQAGFVAIYAVVQDTSANTNPECQALKDHMLSASTIYFRGGATESNFLHFAMEPNASHSNMPDFCACFAAVAGPASLYTLLDTIFQEQNCESALRDRWIPARTRAPPNF